MLYSIPANLLIKIYAKANMVNPKTKETTQNLTSHNITNKYPIYADNTDDNNILSNNFIGNICIGFTLIVLQIIFTCIIL